MARFANLLVVFALIVVMLSEACSTPIEFSQGGMTFVEVGDPGNPSDFAGYGAVDYSFSIGKYEVTINQYCEFLNAVAQSDPYGLYDTRMGTNLNTAGIGRSGTSGAYSYAVMDNAGDSGNRPIAYVGPYSAMRFANWMSNGKGVGSTETGAYTLEGRTGGAVHFSGALPERTANAGFYIPTRDEWWKAAFYNPTNGGANWSHYTNEANILVPVDSSWMNTVTQSASYGPNQNYLTAVGAFGANASYYGTFDQVGNVEEWTFLPNGNGELWGGDWSKNVAMSGLKGLSINFSSAPGFWYGAGVDDSYWGYTNNFVAVEDDFGLRLAYIQPVPEPSSVLLAGAGVCGCIMWHLRRRRVA